MDSENTAFGIDLGTTHSCIAYVDEASGKPSVATNLDSEPTTPSVVLFEGTNRVVGKEAKNSALLSPERVVEMVKRQMGTPHWRFMFEEKEYTAEEISSYILRKVAEDTKTTLGTAVREVVITCPAYFGIAEREATANAGRIAGLTVLEVINEPTAAALSYRAHVDGDQTVLVFDLGGGTFDVTMIEIKDGSVRVVATGGDHQLGGRDWDEAIVNYFAEQWQQGTGSTDDPRESEDSRQELWQRAEDAKRTLSARTEVSKQISHDGKRVTVALTREKFDELTAHLLERTVQFTKTVLKTAAGLGTSTFDKLLLVGGSTKMPQVPARLRDEFKVTPELHDPDLSVAKGAAIYAQKLKIDKKIYIEIENLMQTWGEPVNEGEVPDGVRDIAVENVAISQGLTTDTVDDISKMKVTNVASKSFGIVIIDSNDPERSQIISNLVLAQEGVPATKSETYRTVVESQRVVDIRVMENTERERDIPLERGRAIGHAVLKLAEGLPDRSPVEVVFELTQDGRLQVTGRDLAESGGETTAVIETDRGLSKEEMTQALERAQDLTVSG